MKFNFSIEDVKYLKILYKSTDGTPETIKAAMHSVDDKEILACIKFDEDISAKTPQEVTLSIVCSDGLYRTQTKLVSVKKEYPYIFLILKTPLGLEYQQNREYFRVDMTYSCEYSVPEEDEEMQKFSTQTVDISANGASIILPIHKISEQQSFLDIDIDGKIIHTEVRYVRSEKLESGYKLSFTYQDISESDRDYISRACIKKQLELRRSGLI